MLIEDAIDDLLAGRFKKVARDVIEIEETSLHSYKKPGQLPAARLVEAYALAGIGDYEKARGIIREELRRLKPGSQLTENMISYHIALDTLIHYLENGGRSKLGAFAHYNGLVAEVARNNHGEAGKETVEWDIRFATYAALKEPSELADVRTVGEAEEGKKPKTMKMPLKAFEEIFDRLGNFDALLKKVGESRKYLTLPMEEKKDYRTPGALSRIFSR
ncbi:hypothetical protein JXB11_01345 [Candidatus Woesearchaeota archaeon]|nr:hypothetical protein [Candidatus Woesearchaeota archaeon]